MLTDIQNLLLTSNIWLKTNTILLFLNCRTVLLYPVKCAIDLLQIDEAINRKAQSADCRLRLIQYKMY